MGIVQAVVGHPTSPRHRDHPVCAQQAKGVTIRRGRLFDMAPDSITVRSARKSDVATWADLYRGYRDFYRLQPDAAVIERVWEWITDDEHEVRALVAESGNDLVGLAHYRSFSRPSSASTGLYLDDLFTVPSMRGRGVGRQLLAELSGVAAREGHSVVRWITAKDNSTARQLYDSVATATEWVTYDIVSSQ